MDHDGLVTALKQERLGNYIKLRGGFVLPLAGAVYWIVLGGLGHILPLQTWLLVAFFGTGAIFPLGLLFAKLFNNNFMQEKQVVASVLLPAFIAMLLFWPMLIASLQVSAELAILILAIGMSIHWPVIGWMYNRTLLYSSHSIVRGLIVLGLWMMWPEERMTLIPFAVAGIYFLTVLVILVDTAMLRRKISD